MLLVVAVGLSVLIAVLRGGRFSRLSELRVEHAWAALAALALQLPLAYGALRYRSVAGIPVTAVIMLGSSVLLLWLLWANRRLPGIPLVALGVLANAAVMAANGGWMPVTAEVLEQIGMAGQVVQVGSLQRVVSTKDIVLTRADTRLWWLSDVLVLPRPFPLPSAFSVGDVFVSVGLFWLLQAALVVGLEGPEVSRTEPDAGAES